MGIAKFLSRLLFDERAFVPPTLFRRFEKRNLKREKGKKYDMRVYMDGCFDLAHFGHANALRQARHIGEKEDFDDDAFNAKDDFEDDFEKKDGKNATTRTTRTTTTCELVVGIVSDAEIARCKGPPVVPEEERVKCVKAVKWVDDVITNVPYELTPEFVERLFSGTHVASRRFFCTSLLFSSLSFFSHTLSVCLSFHARR